MDAFAKLREQARARRDATCAIARAEYLRALANIRELSSHEDDEPPYDRLACLILDLAPTGSFGLQEMLLRVREAGQPYARLSAVRQAIYRLVRAGEFCRDGADLDARPLWCLSGEWAPTPLTRLGIIDALATLLDEVGPLRPIEAAIVLQDRGYRPHLSDRELYGSVRQALIRNSGRFREGADGRWAVSSQI